MKNFGAEQWFVEIKWEVMSSVPCYRTFLTKFYCLSKEETSWHVLLITILVFLINNCHPSLMWIFESHFKQFITFIANAISCMWYGTNLKYTLAERCKWMSVQSCLSWLLEVKPSSDRVGPLTVVGLVNESIQPADQKVPSILRHQVCLLVN